MTEAIEATTAATATTLILVRHPETGDNAAGRLPSRPPGPLTEAGRDRIATLVDELASLRPAVVVSSPASRALAVALPLGSALGMPVRVDADLAEYDPGDAAGCDAPTARTLATAGAGPDEPAYPGAEPYASFRTRVERVVRRLRGESDAGPVAVIAHAAVIGAILGEAESPLPTGTHTVHHL